MIPLYIILSWESNKYHLSILNDSSLVAHVDTIQKLSDIFLLNMALLQSQTSNVNTGKCMSIKIQTQYFQGSATYEQLN